MIIIVIIETLETNLKRINESICTLHANYLSGNTKKMNRMKEYGFWLATTDENGHYTDQCKEYIPYTTSGTVASSTSSSGSIV